MLGELYQHHPSTQEDAESPTSEGGLEVFGVYSWRRKWQPTPVFLPGESHGRRSLVGYSTRVTKSWARLSDFTSLHLLFSVASWARGRGTYPILVSQPTWLTKSVLCFAWELDCWIPKRRIWNVNYSSSRGSIFDWLDRVLCSWPALAVLVRMLN